MCQIFNLLHGVFVYSMVPESPRWLLLKGHVEEAVQVLKTLAASNRKPLPTSVTLKKGEIVERSSTIFDLFSFQSIFIRTTVITAGWYEVYLLVCICMHVNVIRSKLKAVLFHEIGLLLKWTI